MADIWSNSVACHPRATYHIAGCCHLVNSLSRFQSHISGCSHLAKSVSWSCHIAECKNFICHIENRFSPYFIFLFLMQFRLWRVAASVSLPIHLFIDAFVFGCWAHSLRTYSISMVGPLALYGWAIGKWVECGSRTATQRQQPFIHDRITNSLYVFLFSYFL